MSRISQFARASAAFALLAAPAMARAAEEAAGAHGADDHGAASANPVAFQLVPFVSALIIFGVAFWILGKFVWPKILGGLDARDEHIRSQVFQAEEARKKADEALAEYEKSVAAARAEAQEMIEKTKAEQTRLAAELRTQAETELNQLRESARRNIEAAKRAALTEIYNEAATLATNVAEKILQREVNEDDQRRLVEESVEQFSKEYAS